MSSLISPEVESFSDSSQPGNVERASEDLTWAKEELTIVSLMQIMMLAPIIVKKLLCANKNGHLGLCLATN